MSISPDSCNDVKQLYGLTTTEFLHEVSRPEAADIATAKSTQKADTGA